MAGSSQEGITSGGVSPFGREHVGRPAASAARTFGAGGGVTVSAPHRSWFRVYSETSVKDRSPVLFCCRGRGAGVNIRYLLGLVLASAVLSWLLGFFMVVLARGWNLSRCPRCQSSRIRPSWPRFADGILYRTHISPYRCEACKKRFYKIRGKPALAKAATSD